jgi:beta-glucuronidase
MRFSKLSCVLVFFVAVYGSFGCRERLSARVELDHQQLAEVNAYPLGQNLIINVDHRSAISLDGKWQAIIDPFEIGYYDYRYQPIKNGFFKNAKPRNKTELIEYGFDKSEVLNVPGDWNSQQDKLLFYEGTIWYKKSFDYQRRPNTRVFVYFGAANYHSIVYLNGQKLGEHVGGFTPFNFEITHLVREKDNFLIVKIDNKRLREGVPTLNTDWWNYGGLTRRVMLVEVPETFIRDYFIQLKMGSLKTVKGWIQLDGKQTNQTITVEIPKANIEQTFNTNADGYVEIEFDAELQLWSPENPRLYDVIIKSQTDSLSDSIGFRSIETKGSKILLNGKPIFLRGICIHEQAPKSKARAFSKEHAEILLGWAKEMNCNFVRLAHYPHNEYMLRTADRLGMLVWSEIPVYWTILWENESTLKNALNQLTEMINRDKNKACIILWSVANEAPVGDARNEFLRTLVERAKSLDPTRLITAAMEKSYEGSNKPVINDPFGQYVDVLGCNEYIGWYEGLPDRCDLYMWKTIYNKPVIISEFGGGALYGFHADKDTRWSEEYQEYLYEKQIKMLDKISFLAGTCPWILSDFRSPRRLLPQIQDYWNRKGLISDKGEKKKAFYVMQRFYEKLKQNEQ